MARTCLMLLIACAVALAFPAVAFANSSWWWTWESLLKPSDLFPIAVAVTLAIEMLAVELIARAGRPLRSFLTVAAANLFSFGAPILVFAIDEIHPLSWYLEHQPIYLVGPLYLVMTLAIEVPIVYALLYRDDDKPYNRKLLATIIGANVVTTALVAIIEQTLCFGTMHGF